MVVVEGGQSGGGAGGCGCGCANLGPNEASLAGASVKVDTTYRTTDGKDSAVCSRGGGHVTQPGAPQVMSGSHCNIHMQAPYPWSVTLTEMFMPNDEKLHPGIYRMVPSCAPRRVPPRRRRRHPRASLDQHYGRAESVLYTLHGMEGGVLGYMLG